MQWCVYARVYLRYNIPCCVQPNHIGGYTITYEFHITSQLTTLIRFQSLYIYSSKKIEKRENE